MAQIACSFCGKSAHQVERLIAGPSAFICNECVMFCVGILEDGPVVSVEPMAAASEEPAALRPDVLVRMPDGTVHACQQETDWAPFVHEGRTYAWCGTSGLVRGKLPVPVVAVRGPEDTDPTRGAAFPPDTKLTEEHGRALVERT
jgi:hypothetical protein